jgi:hypothetical protein
MKQAPVGPNGVPPHYRTFRVKFKFHDNQVGQADVYAIDHVAALVKICGFFSDQPAAVTQMNFEDVTGQRILPASAPARLK